MLAPFIKTPNGYFRADHITAFIQSKENSTFGVYFDDGNFLLITHEDEVDFSWLLGNFNTIFNNIEWKDVLPNEE